MKKYYVKKEGVIYSFLTKNKRDCFLADARMQFEWGGDNFYYVHAKKIPARDYASNGIKVVEIS